MRWKRWGSIRTSPMVGLLAGLTMVLMVGGIALAGDLPPGGTFTDDNGNVHEGSIEAVAAEGITRGCNPPANTQFCPSSPVTRGQMAAFLARALDLPATGVDYFVDDDGSIFENDINKLAESGVTKGCNPPANTMFCPNSKITRGQMAAFLVRAFGYSEGGGGNLFIDDDGSVFENDIDKLGTAGVTKGCNPPTNSRYCPTSVVSRDQMATFLTRAMDLTPIVPPPSTLQPNEIAWLCTWDDFLSKYDCSGNVDKSDAAVETWRCSWGPSLDDWICTGDIYKSSFYELEIWYTYGVRSEDLSSFGVVGEVRFECWTKSQSDWDCDGDIDQLDRVNEEWTCDWSDVAVTWLCAGQVDKRSTAVESWTCVWYASLSRWDCRGDSTREVMLTPIRKPPALP